MTLYQGLDKTKIGTLYDSLKDQEFTSEAKVLLEVIGGTVALRKRVNNYWTFVTPNFQNGQESVIIKEYKGVYSAICSCQEFQKNAACSHIYAVVISVCNSLNAESSINANIENKHLQHWKTWPPFVLPNVKDFSRFVFKEVKNTINHYDFAKTKYEVKTLDNGYQCAFRFESLLYIVSLKVNEMNGLEIYCSCREISTHHLCLHAKMATFHIYNYSFQYPFKKFYNYDLEKNRLLEKYGLSIQDEEAQQFQFKVQDTGNIEISKTPISFQFLERLSTLTELLKMDDSKYLDILPYTSKQEEKIGIFLQISKNEVSTDTIRLGLLRQDKRKSGTIKYQEISIHEEKNLAEMSKLPRDVFDGILHYKVFQGSPTFEHDETVHIRQFFKQLRSDWETFSNYGLTYLVNSDTTRIQESHVEQVKLSLEKPAVQFRLLEEGSFYILETFYILDGEDLNRTEIDVFFGQLAQKDNTLYLVDDEDLANFLLELKASKIYIPKFKKEEVLSQFLLPLREKFNLSFPESMQLIEQKLEPQLVIYFRENSDNYLVIETRAQYGQHDLSIHSFKEFIISTEGDGQIYTRRDRLKELSFNEYIRSLNPLFATQDFEDGFHLGFDEVMKNNWFIETTKTLIDKEIKIIGIQELKKFRYNTNTPEWKMSISSGMDWFDIQVEVSWGENKIQFKDLRHAILAKQNFVILDDGSFGMIPEEWIKKYFTVFKLGSTSKSNEIKLSKKQFNIIDILFDQISDRDIRKELDDKKSRLLHLKDVNTEPLPDNILATLRPYQVTGYQWLQVLDEISWGACLADDMGLGKTLQTICFLSYLKNKYNNPTSLIICPTTLIYNWENELQKFAPSLKYFIYYGSSRSFSDDHFDGHDVIITSYGIARIDVESLMKFNWEYVILDESQAIKNPDAITTKAVQLIPARNKLILSGTPYQNNTYDLFAQFNFLNPGLLGNLEFFKNNFAIPIDRDRDQESQQLLKSILKPFMLRRTKKEVASDLPDKIESVIWCQMGSQQRAVYDEYKDFYRLSLLKKIEDLGIQKTGVYILEGLLRLRQICDDTRLLKNSEIKPMVGVKIEELLREILENSGDHKMLVFSQFTEMLELIRQELDKKQINFHYLDGGTSAAKRKDLIQSFQENFDVKVFLISLKAGGVGINLTAADYVYIVDPWWNPAAELQAIDRVHRIGQKNTIFAYKMICKDTVEEKILKLQEKKLDIASELISDDGSFFKKLTKEDVEFLFS
ncbi:MAG: DEAD/DEAH box helicase [Lewinellaceae bacterium]|nr:DEAD/DEAH box helicase [Lewinellaceae bacterium]